MGGLVVKELLVQASQDEKRHDKKRARLVKKTAGIVGSSSNSSFFFNYSCLYLFNMYSFLKLVAVQRTCSILYLRLLHVAYDM